jgi:hypothetical protein
MGFQNKKTGVQEMFLGRRQNILSQLLWGIVSFWMLAGVASDWSLLPVFLATQGGTFVLLHFWRSHGKI